MLFASMAAHAPLGKLMYGFGWPRGTSRAGGDPAAAQLMYYGGDIAELLLLITLFARWHHLWGSLFGREGKRASGGEGCQ